MLSPSVAAELPPGFVEVAAEVPRPPIGAGSGSSFTQWQAWRSPGSSDTLLLGCVATPIPGWVEDMRPSVDARTVSVMNASVERIVGVPVETRDMPGHLAFRPVGSPEGTAWVGLGRTFVGWDAHDVMTCFAACARPEPDENKRADHRRICDASVLGSHLEASLPPPPPGVVLGAVTWAVHHPTTSVRWGAALVFALGVVTVASRRRPRSRI
jgi:hypothetical protein